MKDPLNQRVAVWLKTQGYPLEMEVASAASSCGFEVSQSDYYLDPEDDKPREIDLVISLQRFSNKSTFHLSYNLFVECKSGQDKPWLLLSTPNQPLAAQSAAESRLARFTLYGAFIANDLGEDLLFRSTFNGDICNVFPRLDIDPTLGYGVTQAFREGSEVPFKALMSATKAALSHVKALGQLSLSAPVILAVPVIVIDAPLLSVLYLPETIDLEIREIKRGLLLWKHVVAHRSRIGVYIVHRSELKQFLAECMASARWWTEVPDDVLHEIFAKRYPAERTS